MPKEHPKKIESQNKSYKVIKTLGEGGTSVVYLANDGVRDVALKILAEEVDPVFKDQYVQILKNEFEVLSKLRHGNVAEVYDFEYAKDLGKYFFTTEYINGTDLYNFTSQADIKAKEELFVQMLLALDYVHRCGIIHCDIKCGNALVTQVRKTPVVKLVDFGFATRKLSSTRTVVGTPHYLAPELLIGEKDIDHKIDIYAAGIVFYRLLHRAYPCKSQEVNEIIKWHKGHEPIPFADDLPDYIKQLIVRMIATYPSDRIASCAKALEFINFRTEGRYKKVVGKLAGLQLREGPLVGRSSVLETIHGAIQEIKDKKSPSHYGVMLIGPQGIGKSRLLKEIKYRAELEEIPVKELACFEGRDHVEEFIGLFKEIERTKNLGSSKPEEKRLAIVQWINNLIEKFKKSGLIIMVDDVQLAGSAFVSFMNFFEERIHVNRTEGDMPILTLVGSRPKTELNEVLAPWFEKTCLSKVELIPLAQPDIKDYIEKIGISDTKKVLEAAAAFSGGVPGLVEAYCQHILALGSEAQPPESLAQSYIERAKSLPVPAKRCVEFLSVARRKLAPDDLASLTGFDKGAVPGIIQKLVAIGFANVSYPSMEVAMSNKAIAQVIKSNLADKNLKENSAKLGAWLESKEPVAKPEIATYFAEAEIPDKAFFYAESAAKAFEDGFNNSEAAKFYEMASRFVSDDAKKRDIVRAICRMDILMGRYKEAIKRLEKIFSSGNDVLEDHRLIGMAYAKMHDFKSAKEWYEKGLKKLTDETAITDIVQLKNSLGNVYFYTGDLKNSEKYYTEAIADATECLLLNNNLGLILSAKGDYEQAINFYAGRKKFLEAKSNKRALSLCYAECGYIHMTHNHLAEAISEFEVSYKLAAEIGDWYNILVILGNLVRCYQQTAQFSSALDYALKGLELEANIGSIEEIAQNHLTIGILYETIGIFDLARQHMNMAKDRFAAIANHQMIGWCHLALSYLFKDVNKFDDATRELDDVDKIAKEKKLADLNLWAKCARADLYCEYGKKDETLKILKEITSSPSVEFGLRKKLVELKLGQGSAADFKDLAEKCNNFKELQWEVYAALGDVCGDEDAYAKSFEIIESIAESLSEAYRDSYKSQRFRLKIVKRFVPEYSVDIKESQIADKKSLESKTTAFK